MLYRHRKNFIYMKEKLCMCACGLLSLGLLTACSDDEGEVAGGGYGLMASTTPSVAHAGIDFPVTEIRNGNTVEFKFDYTSGKMTGCESYNEVYEFAFNPLAVTYSDDYDTETFRNIKVNSDGFITYCELHGNSLDEEDEGYSWDYSASYAYDKDGHLVFEKCHGTDSDGESDTYTSVYTWEGGNLIKAEETSIYDYDGEVEEEKWITEFEYDAEKYPNPGIYYCMDVVQGSGLLYSFFFYAGMAGRTTKNIPVTYSQIDEMQYVRKFVTTGCTYNEDGSLRSVLSRSVNNDGSYGYSTSFSYGYKDYPLPELRSSVQMAAGTKKGKLFRRLRERMEKTN